MKEWVTNRDKKRLPKQGKFWCWGCDAQLVHETPKCPNCGWKNHKKIKRNKK